MQLRARHGKLVRRATLCLHIVSSQNCWVGRSGLRDSVQSFSSEVAGTDAHDVMDMMVLTQVTPP